MTKELECPEWKVQPVLAYTADIAGAKPWGMVTGSGPTPEQALENLSQRAHDRAEQLFGLLWKDNAKLRPPWLKAMAGKANLKRNERVSLSATFRVGSTRLAYGRTEHGPEWVAYGTLLTDGGGDGIDWLQPDPPNPKGAG